MIAQVVVKYMSTIHSDLIIKNDIKGNPSSLYCMIGIHGDTSVYM